MEIERYELLTKSEWDVKDIQTYYDCGLDKAVRIKAKVIDKFGATDYTDKLEKTKVATDNVLKIMGGNSRSEELDIVCKVVSLMKMSKDIKNEDIAMKVIKMSKEEFEEFLNGSDKECS